MATFVPTTALETAIHAGDADATLALLRALDARQRAAQGAAVRRLAKVAFTARWRSDPGEWGGKTTDAQWASVHIATVLCGAARDVAAHAVDDDLLVTLCTEFRPRSLDGLADALLARSPQRIRPVSKLIAAGLVERPDTDDYTRGLIALPQAIRTQAELEALFAGDPGLRPALLRVFGIEGTGDVSLASSDKYCHGRWAQWDELLLALVDDGLATRAQLLDLTLGALEKDWPQFRAGWFSRFHGALAPSVDEMLPALPRYLALCASRIAPTVTLVLEALREIDAAAPIAAEALIEALRPVASSAVRAQLEAALTLLDRLVEREPVFASRAAGIVSLSLLHDAAPVQALALARLGRWGVDDALRDRLAGLAAGIAATNRRAFDALIGDGARAADVRATTPAATSMPRPRLEPVEPLAGVRRVAPVSNVDDLVDVVAHVFEHPDDVEGFERAIAGLVVAAPVADPKRFAPVLKRAARMRALLPRELARLLRFVVSAGAQAGPAGIDDTGQPGAFAIELIARIDEMMRLAAVGGHVEPLATPTHRGGFIAPMRLAQRWREHAAAGTLPSPAEQARALMRVAPDADAAVLGHLRGMPDDAFVRALRHVLSDDVELGGSAALRSAAARVRPIDRGIDGESAPSYVWRVDSSSHEADGRTYTHHFFRLDAQPSANADADAALAVLHRRHEREISIGADAGAIRYAATLLPSDLQDFFAEGTQAIGNNLDWWSADWHDRAWIEPLLEPTTAMGSMARLLLVLALAGKESGQTALAVDALVHAHAEGRLEALPLAVTLREVLATPLMKAARLHKSLQAALRADPAIADLVFALLGAAVQARPDDPPRDVALLLGLMLELKVAGARTLSPAVIDALTAMPLSGPGKATRKALLQA